MCKVTKNFKIIPRLGLLSLFVLFANKTLFTQEVEPLNGVFEGEHIEYTTDGSNDTLNYIYKLELEQVDQQVNGQSFIYNDEGYYAVVKLRGVVIEDEFYFEEYNTLDEINPAETPWCYNSGHLQIKRTDLGVELKGYTKSYTKAYGAFCRAGYTELVQSYDPNTARQELDASIVEPAHSIFLDPNPTDAESSLKFVLAQSNAQVIVEVRDLQGELILEPLNRELVAGSYDIPIDLSFQKEGMYIIELIVDRTLYTAELWKETF